MTVSELLGPENAVGAPRWIRPSLNVKEGRDPLGMQTTTQDRLMPGLLPGILELSRRARYFSYHAYFLEKYRKLRLRPDASSLSSFIKAREWEFGLAVLLCPHRCDSSPVGVSKLRGIRQEDPDVYLRGESVESAFGGYGLYYRSPLADLGIVARAGTLVGDKPTPIDVLRNRPRANRLATAFNNAVSGTDYIETWMLTSDPIPRDVLVEYARVACLCQLPEHPEERAAVHQALFGWDEASNNSQYADGKTAKFEDAGGGPPVHLQEASDAIGEVDDRGDTSLPTAVTQRQHSVAHFLSLISVEPQVVHDDGAYRQALWSASSFLSNDHQRVASQWAALIAKDVWQDSLCSIWFEFCRLGVYASSNAVGLTWSQVCSLASNMTNGDPVLAGDEPTNDLIERITTGDVALPELGSSISEASLEQLRQATERLNSASSGLIAALELYRRTESRTEPGWSHAASMRSAWQQSLAEVLLNITAHLNEDPTVADTLWWLTRHYVLNVHERIAYSKLPEHTFRFRWEEGRLRFYDNGIGRFQLAAIRQEPLAQLTQDLALWEFDTTAGRAQLTDRGRIFLQESL